MQYYLDILEAAVTHGVRKAQYNLAVKQLELLFKKDQNVLRREFSYMGKWSALSEEEFEAVHLMSIHISKFPVPTFREAVSKVDGELYDALMDVLVKWEPIGVLVRQAKKAMK